MEPGPCPKSALLFFDSSSLSPHSFPSVISNCLSVPFGASLMLVKNLPAMQETLVWLRGQEDPLEKDRLPTPVFSLENSTGLQRVRHDRVPFTFTLGLREGHGGWCLFPANKKQGTGSLLFPGAPQCLAQFQMGHGSYPPARRGWRGIAYRELTSHDAINTSSCALTTTISWSVIKWSFLKKIFCWSKF